MNRGPKVPLQRLVRNDEFYKYFLAKLDDPNERDIEGRTLLHIASWSVHENSRNLKLLLDRGAVVNSVTPEGYTALHFAVCSRNRNAVVALIKASASVNSKDSFGRTALHFAITKRWTNPPSPLLNYDCDLWIVERLLFHPEINPNPKAETGETPLMCAVKEQNWDAVMVLLKRGANPNKPNKDNRTPLHVALLARKPSFEIVFLLLNNGSNLCHEDKFQMTPMGILTRIVYDEKSLEFASDCLRTVAFRYQIRQSLKRELETIPELANELNECCNEVGLMRKVRINGNFTLHDFALDCFQAQVENPVQTIYTPLVENLLTGLFSKYYKFILHCIPLPDMRRMLVERGTAENFMPIDESHFTIYREIRKLYDENDVLKQRVLRLKENLIKTFNISCK